MSTDNKIKLDLVNIDTGKVFATSYMDLDQLPEAFELETTLYLDDGDWLVKEAIPMHSKDFKISKQLTLKLKKVEMMNPKDMLFSLPTICAVLPPISEKTLFNDFQLHIHEDDWRQIEFLSKTELPLIEQEIEGIKNIFNTSSIKLDNNVYGFKGIHVREKIKQPDIAISFESLTSLLKATALGSISFEDQAGYIDNAFAIKSDYGIFYGLVNNSIVNTLCISERNQPLPEDILNIAQVNNLVFIDWCKCEIIM